MLEYAETKTPPQADAFDGQRRYLGDQPADRTNGRIINGQ